MLEQLREGAAVLDARDGDNQIAELQLSLAFFLSSRHDGPSLRNFDKNAPRDAQRSRLQRRLISQRGFEKSLHALPNVRKPPMDHSAFVIQVSTPLVGLETTALA